MFDFLIAPIISFFAAQGIKFLIKITKNKKLETIDFFAYSDMPSSHTATIISMATIILLKEGFRSPLFAMAVIVSAIVITDAMRLRSYVGLNSKAINSLMKRSEDKKEIGAIEHKELQEKIGHKPKDILAGALIGSIISVLVWLI